MLHAAHETFIASCINLTTKMTDYHDHYQKHKKHFTIERFISKLYENLILNKLVQINQYLQSSTSIL